MEIKSLKSEEDYQAAFEKLEHVFDVKKGTTEGDDWKFSRF